MQVLRTALVVCLLILVKRVGGQVIVRVGDGFQLRAQLGASATNAWYHMGHGQNKAEVSENYEERFNASSNSAQNHLVPHGCLGVVFNANKRFRQTALLGYQQYKGDFSYYQYVYHGQDGYSTDSSSVLNTIYIRKNYDCKVKYEFFTVSGGGEFKIVSGLNLGFRANFAFLLSSEQFSNGANSYHVKTIESGFNMTTGEEYNANYSSEKPGEMYSEHRSSQLKGDFGMKFSFYLNYMFRAGPARFGVYVAGEQGIGAKRPYASVGLVISPYTFQDDEAE